MSNWVFISISLIMWLSFYTFYSAARALGRTKLTVKLKIYRCYFIHPFFPFSFLLCLLVTLFSILHFTANCVLPVELKWLKICYFPYNKLFILENIVLTFLFFLASHATKKKKKRNQKGIMLIGKM